ncbi:MAG: hypothetical protein O7A04_05500, partial [Acidobacteria bacterium]|nr:hypothetical protein [Acidobacteriota bacterium]
MLSRGRSVLVALSVALAASTLAGAVEFDSPAALRASLDQTFELLQLSNGLLLTPREAGSGPRAIEVLGSAIALDGIEVGTDELRVRLGAEAADLVLALAALDEAERREMLAIPVALPAEDEAVVVVAENAADALTDVESEPVADRRARREKKKHYRRSGDSEIAFGSSLTVAEGEVTDDVLVVGGVLKVKGRVEGDATVIGGSATIEGEVVGDLTSIGGPIRLEDGSHVHGDVTTFGSRVYQADGAQVDGRVEEAAFNADFSFGPWKDWRRWNRHDRSHDFDFSPWGWWTGVGWGLVKLLFLAGLAWLSLLLFRRPIERMQGRVAREPWKTGLVGLLAQVLFIPMIIMLAVFLAISIIGIPLLLVLPFGVVALGIVGWLGFVAVAGRVGSWAEERFGWRLGSPFWLVLVGFLLIASLSIIGDLLNFGIAPMRFIAGMFIFFGAIVSWAAWTIGFGAAVLTRFGTADSWDRAEEIVAPLPPVPGYTETYE